MTNSPIITALCSFGMSGQVFHAPFLEAHQGFVLHSILERSKSLSSVKYPNATIVRDFETILHNPLIELVVINTPNQLHESMAAAALKAGKHVIIEKPFALSTEGANYLIELAQSQERSLLVFHNKRFEGEFKTVKQLVNSCIFGKITYFETHFDRYRPEIGAKKWKEEDPKAGGILYDLAPHMVDQIVHLFGKPIAVHADLQIQRKDSKVVDYFKITFDYPDFNAIATAGMLVEPPHIKYLIKGQKGRFEKYGNDPQEALLKEGISPLTENLGIESPEQWGVFTDISGQEKIIPTLSGNYMDYFETVFQHLRYNAPMPISLEDAYTNVEIIEKCTRNNSF